MRLTSMADLPRVVMMGKLYGVFKVTPLHLPASVVLPGSYLGRFAIAYARKMEP
jgi:hypothetical protein